MLEVFASSSNSMESHALEKTTNYSVVLSFFAWSPLIIWQIVRIYDVVDWFLWKPFLIFLKNFLNMLEKQSIISLSSCRSKIYASILLGDSDVTFLRERKDVAFCLSLLYFVYIWCCKIKEVCKQTSFSSILLGYFIKACSFSAFNFC